MTTSTVDICHVDVLHTRVVQFSNTVDPSNRGSLTKIDLECVLRMAEEYQQIVHEAFNSLRLDQEDNPCQFQIGQLCDKEDANIVVMRTCVKSKDISTICLPSINSKVTATVKYTVLLIP